MHGEVWVRPQGGYKPPDRTVYPKGCQMAEGLMPKYGEDHNGASRLRPGHATLTRTPMAKGSRFQSEGAPKGGRQSEGCRTDSVLPDRTGRIRQDRGVPSAAGNAVVTVCISLFNRREAVGQHVAVGSRCVFGSTRKPVPVAYYKVPRSRVDRGLRRRKRRS